jgi:hypothetical protein
MVLGDTRHMDGLDLYNALFVVGPVMVKVFINFRFPGGEKDEVKKMVERMGAAMAQLAGHKTEVWVASGCHPAMLDHPSVLLLASRCETALLGSAYRTQNRTPKPSPKCARLECNETRESMKRCPKCQTPFS